LSPEAESLLSKEESRRTVVALAEEIDRVPEVTPETYRQITSAVGSKLHVSGKALFMPLRAALTGKTRGPELEKVFVLLGKEKVSRRLRAVPLPNA
jgi:nondiscriminating glutamyl-tRNA synthetase